MTTTSSADQTTATNYAQQAMALFAGYGDAEALVYGSRRLTHTELVEGVRAIRSALLAHGVGAGDAVAVLPINVPETVLTQVALHLLGCRAVWLGTDTPVSLMAQTLGLADVTAFIYNPVTNPELGRELTARVPQLRPLCLGPGGVGPDLTAPVSPDADAAPDADVAPDADAGPDVEAGPDGAAEPQSLFQTGGTTGKPKLVHHRHTFFLNLLDAARRYVDGGNHPLRHLALSGLGTPAARRP